MVVELPTEPSPVVAEAPWQPSAPSAEQAATLYPHPFPQQQEEGGLSMQPVPVVVRTEDGSQQVVYMYPVMPNPHQFQQQQPQQTMTQGAVPQGQ